MKKITVLLTSFLFLLCGCTKKKEGDDVPSCLNVRINQLAGNSLQVDSVSQYSFNGRSVYLLVINQCCDIDLPVLDNDCNTVCRIGGLAGNYYCEGLRFDSTAVFIETVWRR